MLNPFIKFKCLRWPIIVIQLDLLRQSYFNQIQDDPQISKKGGILTMNHFSNNFSHLWSNLYNFFAKLLNFCGPFSRHPSLERNLNLNKKIIFLLVIPKQMQNKFSFLSISEVGEKQWAEEEERRKKKVSENNGQLHFHGSHLDQFSCFYTH